MHYFSSAPISFPHCIPLTDQIKLFIRPSVRPFVFRFFVRLFVCSFVRSFVRSFVSTSVRSPVCSFLRQFFRSFFRSFVLSFVRWPVCSFVRSFISVEFLEVPQFVTCNSTRRLNFLKNDYLYFQRLIALNGPVFLNQDEANLRLA